MGKRGSKLCVNCFGREEPTDSLPDPPMQLANPKKATAETDEKIAIVTKTTAPISQEAIQLAMLPEEDQRLVNHIESSVELFFNLINTPANEDSSLELLVDKAPLRVYGKDTPRGFMLRSEWLMPYTPEEFIKFLGDVQLRINWDKKMESVQCAKTIQTEYAVYYQTYKKIMLLDQRDLLYVSKTLQQGDAWIDICSSIELPEFPEKPGIVRMKLFLGGYFAEPLPTPQGNLIARVTCVSECDFGGAVPRAIVKKVSAITIPSYVKEVEEALKKHLSR